MKITSGTKGVVAYDRKILLILRDNKPDIPYPNTWELVGGAKEEKESLEEAGIREVEEELGIRPKHYVFIGSDIYLDRIGGRFICLLSKDEFERIKLGVEGKEYQMFSIDEAINLPMAPNLKTFLLDNIQAFKNILEKNQQIENQTFIYTNERI